MSAYDLTEMNETDLDAVLEIYTHYVLNTTATFHDHRPVRAEMHELVFFSDPRYRTFILRQDPAVLGYVFLAPHSKREAYNATGEVSIYLRPDQTGQGLGRLALDHIEAFARKQNFHVLLATICEQNEPSLKLFLRHGYRQCAHYEEVGRKFGQWLGIIGCQKILA